MAAPFTPASVRIEFVNGILPIHDLVFEPHPPV
jgi:hypothetical protein